MRAVASGDLGAFNEIVRRHQEVAWRIAWRFLGDRHAAEDAVQEAFLRILDRAASYKPSASFKTYLFRVVTRLCLDHARKHRPVPTDRLPQVADSEPDAASRMADVEREQSVRAALDSLPPNQRMAVVLRYLAGLSVAEVAVPLGVSAKAAERLLARAREALQPKLARLIEE
jgi:RNA polymerase sigma-70 factor (ECF subfamily)